LYSEGAALVDFSKSSVEKQQSVKFGDFV